MDCPNCELDYTATPIRIVFCALHSAAEKLRDALEFYADPRKYEGPNQRAQPDEQGTTGLGQGYRIDVRRDQGDIARAALVAAKGE